MIETITRITHRGNWESWWLNGITLHRYYGPANLDEWFIRGNLIKVEK